MNNRFKFRIWDKKLNKLSKWGDNPYHNMEIMNYICVEEPVTDWKHEDYVLMQCTGLKDKNGKLIYEGDIVKDISLNMIFEVGYKKCVFYLENKEHIGFFHELAIAYSEKRLEVIGNIYENKELLESEG